MPRYETQHYRKDLDTVFAWATDDNDKFDRALDLYNLSQALERHDHSTGRGQPVAGQAIADNTITNAMLQANSVTSVKIQDGTIQRGDLANNLIDDSKLDSPRVLRTGDTITGTVIINGPSANTGNLKFGTGENFIFWNGSQFYWQNVSGSYNAINASSVRVYRTNPNAGQGLLEFGINGDGKLLWDGTAFYMNGARVTTAAAGTVPVGGIIMVESMGVMNGLPASWQRDTRFDGRMPIGNGVATWGDYNDGSTYHSTMIGIGSQNIIGQSGFSTKASVNYLLPPAFAVVFARRIS